jgi:hypothetical protein
VRRRRGFALPGHATMAMTMRYMHLAPSALREAISLLNVGQQAGQHAGRHIGNCLKITCK